VALEEELASGGARFSILEVAVENREALALYAKLGYARAAILVDYYGPGKDALLMTKRLK
jgi:ribosomal-protein-alanine N-acetyltransferase